MAVMHPCLFLVFTLVLALSALQGVRPQTPSKEISKKEQELARLRSEIEAFEGKLKESEKRERSTLEHLDNLERQSNLMRHLIKKLREQEQQITHDIREARLSIDELEIQLEALKSHYAKYVRSVYKYGRVYDLELLFSSNSINQLYIRIQYLKRFSEQRVKDLQVILQKKGDLEEQNDRLQQNLDQERRLLAEKTSEESSLKRKVSQRQKTLATIRKDQRVYQQELRRKNDAVREIEKMIADLIEKEHLRKEREAAARERERLATDPARPPEPEPEAVGSFAAQKGKLRWPVSSGTISSRFGNQVHPVLKTVTENTGIDIRVRLGSDVLAVADGEVSILSFIPGFGNVVILNHYDGFRTVYAHLSEITVVEAQKVRSGQTIAKSGEWVQGPILHFEIWREREKQNPELWLTRPR
jgi:septal ring factor EnvC (AmiA/AmiB activator)